MDTGQTRSPTAPFGRTGEHVRRARLALEVVGVYARVRWLVLRHGAVPAVAVIRDDYRTRSTLESGTGRLRLGMHYSRVVVRALRLLPTDSRCLMRSLVLTAMLARHGVPATVVIGVRSEPAFGAHAWVEVDGHVLLPESEDAYRRLVEL